MCSGDLPLGAGPEETSTLTCVICRYAIELDDVVLAGGVRGCICLRCFARETGTERPMPKPLRRDLEAVLADAVAG